MPDTKDYPRLPRFARNDVGDDWPRNDVKEDAGKVITFFGG